MSTRDKTRQQLVDSMRKTRGAATKKKPSAAAGGTAVTRRSTKTGAGATAAARQKPGRGRASMGRSGGGDPYQAGRRVWPD
jgi:hypothetical protein